MSLHRETFTSLAKDRGWRRGAELGVDKGILFGMLLAYCKDLSLIGVDTFPDRERSHRVFSLVTQHTPRATVLEMTTRDAAAQVPDASLDFVFIDADHSKAAVEEDVRCWRPKVRAGGWLGGHDYSRKFPGVIAAVDGLFGTKAERWPGHIWGVWL